MTPPQASRAGLDAGPVDEWFEGREVTVQSWHASHLERHRRANGRSSFDSVEEKTAAADRLRAASGIWHPEAETVKLTTAGPMPCTGCRTTCRKLHLWEGVASSQRQAAHSGGSATIRRRVPHSAARRPIRPMNTTCPSGKVDVIESGRGEGAMASWQQRPGLALIPPRWLCLTIHGLKTRGRYR
jgi:hypothetical protein